MVSNIYSVLELCLEITHLGSEEEKAGHSTPTEAFNAMPQDRHGDENSALTHAESDSSTINSDSQGEGKGQSDGEMPRKGIRGGQGKPRVSSPRIVNHTDQGTPVIPWKIHKLSQEGHSFEGLDSLDDMDHSNRHYALRAIRRTLSLTSGEISLPGKICRFVPPSLRAKTLARYPILRQYDGHRAFFLYIMTTTFRDDYTRNPVVSAEQIARCYGDWALKKQQGGNLKVWCMLKRFSSEVFYLEWSEPNKERGEARTIQHTGIDPSLSREWEKALDSPIGEDAVCFWSGKKRVHVSTQQQKCREKLRERSREQEPPCEDSRRWRDYLNRRDSTLFESARSRLPQAYKRVRHDPDFKGQKREEAFRHLRAIEEQPVPIYGFSGNTVRLRALNPSLQTIDGDLRQILTREWIELDLSSAQLAIAGADWGIPEVVEFLSAGKSIWEDLASFLSLPMKVVKPALKKGLYAAVYGASVANIPDFITGAANAEGFQFPEEKAKQFPEHPIVEKLLVARERKLKQIQENGGEEDCYGRTIGYSGIDKKRPERSILAQLNQAREMWLLEPVLSLAENQDEGEQAWEVTLLQHDGFSIQVHNGQEKQVVQTLKSAVADRADSGGYPTRLEVESMNQ